MFRYATLLVLILVADSAWAQQDPLSADTPPAAAPAVSTSPKDVVHMEQPQPGDHWTYEMRDEITGKVTGLRENAVTEVTPKDISVRVKTVGSTDTGFIVYDRSWNLISSGTYRYSPSDGASGIPARLAVGATSTFRTSMTNSANGTAWQRSGTSKVVGQETMITKAGIFETFKIETIVSMRNANDPTRKTEFTFQTWYAPAIDHWVKRSSVARTDQHLRENMTLELTEYGRKQ
jgi:hypothetical protein